jgi:hypothetical protein
MRYLILTYYTKPDGQIDEVMAVSKNLKSVAWFQIHYHNIDNA